MGGNNKELLKIRRILKDNPRGMTIREVSDKIRLNRNSTAKYLDILYSSGYVEMKMVGPAKAYFLSRKVSSEQLSLLIENLPVIPYACEAHSDFAMTYIGRNIEKITGFKPRSFLSSPSFLTNRIHSEDKKKVMKAMEELPEKGKGEVEYRWRTAEGSYKWFHDVMRTVKESDGTVSHIVGALQDITKRKEAEEAFSKSQSNYLALLYAIPDMIFIFDREGVYKQYIATKEVQPAIPPEEYLGKKLTDVLPPNIGAQVIQHIERALDSGELQTFRYSMPVILPHGPVHDFEARFVASGKDEVLSIIRDITEQKEAGEKLKESEEKYRQLVESIDANIFILDNKGKFLFVNEKSARDLDMSPSEIVGKTLSDMYSKEMAESQMKVIEKVLETKQAVNLETKTKLQGNDRWFAVSLMPIKHSDGEVHAVQGVAIDVTERKNAENT